MVPLLDLTAQYRSIRDAVDAAIRRVVESQRFILGDEVAALEEEIGARVGVPHALGVASGTDALLLALRAAGVARGEEVVVPAFTFFATAGAVVNAGGRAVFADIEPEGFNLDAAALESALTERTRAIVPVHLFGQCADMEAILACAARHGLAVIEDAAQAIDATFAGRPAGSMGTAGCLSFFPSKNLGGFGDGGMITTADAALDERLRALRVHGQVGAYLHRDVGFNSRLDALQAAVLRAKLPHLRGWTEARRRHAAYYDRRLREIGLAGGRGAPLRLPRELPGRGHVYNQYVVRARRRDALRDHLTAAGIGTAIYYPRPLHRQECFTGLGQAGRDLPAAQQACEEVLALPVYPELTEAQQEEVIGAVARFYGA
jgi:dTDP-4-amino-4,6-dideoxygalactose transaminase